MRVTCTMPRTPADANYTIQSDTLAGVLNFLRTLTEWATYSCQFPFAISVDADGKATGITIQPAPQIEMPSWVGYDNATDAEKTEWRRMKAALRAHEMEHHAIATRGINAWCATARGWTGKTEDEVRTELSTFETNLQAQQDAFDNASQHGGRDGVHLNIP